jgi:hypothetical protein
MESRGSPDITPPSGLTALVRQAPVRQQVFVREGERVEGSEADGAWGTRVLAMEGSDG